MATLAPCRLGHAVDEYRRSGYITVGQHRAMCVMTSQISRLLVSTAIGVSVAPPFQARPRHTLKGHTLQRANQQHLPVVNPCAETSCGVAALRNSARSRRVRHRARDECSGAGKTHRPSRVQRPGSRAPSRWGANCCTILARAICATRSDTSFCHPRTGHDYGACPATRGIRRVCMGTRDTHTRACVARAER